MRSWKIWSSSWPMRVMIISTLLMSSCFERTRHQTHRTQRSKQDVMTNKAFVRDEALHLRLQVLVDLHQAFDGVFADLCLVVCVDFRTEMNQIQTSSDGMCGRKSLPTKTHIRTWSTSASSQSKHSLQTTTNANPVVDEPLHVRFSDIGRVQLVHQILFSFVVNKSDKASVRTETNLEDG